MTIKVLDVNDNEPYSEKPLHTSSVPETALVGAPVMSVSAVDRDNEAKLVELCVKLQSLKEVHKILNFFSI